MNKFRDLEEYLRKEDREDFYLTLSQIEGIIGQHLPKSAYQHNAYWHPSDTHYSANLILRCGYKVSPDLRNERLRLTHIGKILPKAMETSEKKKRTSIVRKDIPEPTKELVESYLRKWKGLENYVAQEEAVDRVFRDYASNDKLENILIKCSVLNDFYSTNIFKIYPVAKHILKLDIDQRLSKKDPTLVDEIARNEIEGKVKLFYSFASKYCSHHRPLDFPIYDSFVHKVLMYFRDAYGFANFKKADLKTYPKFKRVLKQFQNFYKLDDFDLKQLDRFLWQFGKEYFPK